MNKMNILDLRSLLIGLGLMGGVFWNSVASAQDQNHMHDMPSGGMEGMDHGDPEATRALYDELRAKIPLYADQTDQQISLRMQRMGGNFDVYLSGPALVGDVGLLVLAHGFGDKGNEVFKSQVGQLAGIFPTSISLGMSMMTSAHIQASLDTLTAAGANQIIVIPALSTRHNSLLRHWEYIFDMRENPTYASVPRVQTDAKIIFAPPLDDNPLVAEAMLDFANGLSTDPANEVVIILAHGPAGEKDNQEGLAMLAILAEYMKQDGDFIDVKWMSLQDDSPREIRDKNVAALRILVDAETAQGHQVIIVTNLMATRSIQSKIRTDLKGLDYKFASQGFTVHSNFVKWLGDVMHDEILP